MRGTLKNSPQALRLVDIFDNNPQPQADCLELIANRKEKSPSIGAVYLFIVLSIIEWRIQGKTIFGLRKLLKRIRNPSNKSPFYEWRFLLDIF